MRARLRVALTDAMKARDRVAVAALRSALSAIENAEAVDTPVPADANQPADATGPPAGTAEPAAAEPPLTERATVEHAGFAGSVAGLRAAEVERRPLTDADVERIVRAEATDRLAAADEYERGGRHDHAERLRGEAAVLRRYLP